MDALKRNPYTTPVPAPIALGMAFIPEGLSDAQYEREVKKLVRRHLRRVKRDPAPGLIRHFDARVWRIIREVIEEN